MRVDRGSENIGLEALLRSDVRKKDDVQTWKNTQADPNGRPTFVPPPKLCHAVNCWYSSVLDLCKEYFGNNKLIHSIEDVEYSKPQFESVIQICVYIITLIL